MRPSTWVGALILLSDGHKGLALLPFSHSDHIWILIRQRIAHLPGLLRIGLKQSDQGGQVRYEIALYFENLAFSQRYLPARVVRFPGERNSGTLIGAKPIMRIATQSAEQTIMLS